LSIFVSTATIALTDIEVLNQIGTVTSDDIVGSTRTVTWDNGTQLSIQGS